MEDLKYDNLFSSSPGTSVFTLNLLFFLYSFFYLQISTTGLKSQDSTQRHLTYTKTINDHWPHTQTFNIEQIPKPLMITGHMLNFNSSEV